MAAFAEDLIALRRERQPVDLDHVVEHARENLHHLAVGFPVEVRLVRERIDDELGEIDRAEEAGAIGGSGCSPHGFVARMFSAHQLLFISLTLSIRMKPGSAKS